MTTPLTSLFVSSPNLQTYLNDKTTGFPLSGGIVTFYSDINRNTLKPVYQISGSPPNYSVAAIPNPNTVNADGTLSDGSGGRIIPLFYPLDADGNPEQYYITIYNSDNVLQETLENWPPNEAAPAPIISSSTDPVNYMKNSQFLIWEHEPVIATNGKTIITTYVNANDNEQVVDNWYFVKNTSSTTIDKFTQQAFSTAQTEVEGNPRYYLQYQCTATGGGETIKCLKQLFFKNAQFLQGETIVFSIVVKADQVRGLTIKWGQFFGTGGSPSPLQENTIYTTNVTAGWVKYTALVTIPSITGKILGTNYDDYCYITLNMDLNTTCTYNFCNLLLQPGNSLNFIFPEEPYAKQKSRMEPWWQIPTGQLSFDIFGNNNAALDQSYWLPITDQYIGNPNSGADYMLMAGFNLYVLIWNTCSDTWAPVSGGRGADAVSDWNASKKMKIPFSMGRLFGNSGHGAALSNRVPGQAGGLEGTVFTHTHTFDSATGSVPSVNFAAATWEHSSLLVDPGATDSVPFLTNGVGVITNVEATDTPANATGDSMNPFVFFPAYIHL